MGKVKRRLLYTPGLLSLIVLFPICFIYLKNRIKAKEKAVIELNMNTPEFGNIIVSDTLSHFYGLDPIRPYPKRNYLTYYLTGRENQDEATLKEAQVELRKQHISNDTINGVYFYFTNDAKYGAIVNTLNIFMIEDIERFLFVDNEIWVFNIPETEHKSVTMSFCGTASQSTSHTNSASRDVFIIDKDSIIEVSRKFWLPLLLLIALAFFNIQSILKNSTANTIHKPSIG
ncbi:hypothetical protein [Pontibacter beigongshangensis]|uniref:hypothetical protein n=1 Tax=Pontibacter beigongshangensis TaxID=2574733 RepID=UPI0016505D81|nr:hypothetical protein [Pontibacter beigongshangensis]